MIIHRGVLVNAIPTRHGTMVFAELVPSAPLLYRAHFDRGWRRWSPLHVGRSWREPHIRWWYEINEDGPEYTTHCWQHDGGAITLRQAITKANKAVEEAVERLDQEERASSQSGSVPDF